MSSPTTTVLAEPSPTDPANEELSNPLPRDSRISELTSKLMPQIKIAVADMRGGENPDYLKPVEYKIQEDPCSDEMDTNYFVKIQVADNEFIHAKFAQDPKRRLSLCKLTTKEAGDEIENDF